MKNQTKVLTCLCAGTLCMLCQAETLEFANPDDFASRNSVYQDSVFQFQAAGRYMSKRVFPISPDKKYTLRMKIRRTPGSGEVLAHVGFQQFDESGKYLLPEYYRMEKNTLTSLFETAPEGSVQIKIKAPAYWRRDAVRLGWHVAFDTEGSSEDLPNMNVIKIKEIEEIPGGLLVTLQRPLKEPRPAGSKICFHSGGPGMYSLLPGTRITESWQEFSAAVQGMSPVPGGKQWWQDAAKARILFSLSSLSGDPKISVEVKDISLEITE